MLYLTLCLTSIAYVQAPPITIDDYFSLAWMHGCDLSGDGSRVAFAEGRWDEELDRRNTDLWVVNRDGSSPRRLTFDSVNEGSPTWAADGQWLYYTCTRGSRGDAAPQNGRRQVWRMRPDGTDRIAVTHLPTSISLWELVAGDRWLYYTISTNEQEADPWKALRREHDGVEYGHGRVDFSELWRLDLQTWRSERIWDAQRVIVDMAVSPDGSQVALVTTPDGRLITNEGWSELDLLDVESGEFQRLPSTLWRDEAPSPYGWVEAPNFSSDGRRLAFTVDFDGFPREIIVASLGKEITLQRVARPGDVSVDSEARWLPGSHDLAFTAQRGVLRPVIRVSGIGDGRQGAHATLTPPGWCTWAWDVGPRGRLVSVGGTGEAMSVLASVDAVGARTIHDPNPQAASWALPTISTVQWEADDGTRIEGVLELPAGYDAETEGPLPMYVFLHGGPTSAVSAMVSFSAGGRGLLASDGWAVFCPNYRGSTGYGDEFLIELVGRENDVELGDILAGVDAMVAAGIADPERLAVGGWSNGGYLTNCVIAATDRFKAASSGAGVFDQTMQWSIEDTPGHVVNYAGGLPWEVAEEMRRMSPLYDAHRITTPTIIHVGERDERVPAEHARALFRALHDYVGTPAQLLVYIGEGHGLMRMSNRRARMEWDRAWLRHWVLDESVAGVD